MQHARGFSLLELLAASFLGLLVLSSGLYLYKSQHKHMLVKTSISEMRMNGQYALNEAQYYVLLAGLGLPDGFRGLELDGANLVVKLNPTKASFPAAKRGPAGPVATIFTLDRPGDAAAFAEAAHVLVLGQDEEFPVLDFRPATGELRLRGNAAPLPARAELYPVQRLELRRESDGRFRIAEQRPGAGGDPAGALSLAEGIESLRYHFLSKSGNRSPHLPAELDTLERIEIRVTARSQYRDPRYRGDGYRRETFSLVTGYKRSL